MNRLQRIIRSIIREAMNTTGNVAEVPDRSVAPTFTQPEEGHIREGDVYLTVGKDEIATLVISAIHIDSETGTLKVTADLRGDDEIKKQVANAANEMRAGSAVFDRFGDVTLVMTKDKLVSFIQTHKFEWMKRDQSRAPGMDYPNQ